MKATDTLRQEHQAVKLMIQIMEAMSFRIRAGRSVQRQDLDNMIDFLKVFVDRCHHAKEEEILFPALEDARVSKDGGPIGEMLAEHVLGREYIRSINRALLNYGSGGASDPMELTNYIHTYIDLLNEHILKENEVLFPLADRLLTEEIQDGLNYQFEDLEEKIVGLGKHDELHKMLEKMSDTYLV